MTFVFPLGLFEQVAGIVKAKRLPGPRQLSAEQKQVNIARLSRYQFQPASSEQEIEASSSSSEQKDRQAG